jgi:hypothetical protein
MSVRVNDRHLSDIEYENTFSIFNQYISNKLRNLPKRYRHFLGEPFNNILNEIYEGIMKMTSLYLDGKPTSIERYRLGIGILKKIEIVKSLSYTMWNLSSDRKNEIKFIKQKSREFWTESLNKEIGLLSGVIKKCNGYKKNGVEVSFMKSFTYTQIKEIVFLNKLAQLQRIVYKIAIQTSKDYKDAQVEMLVKLSRSAFYNAVEGNAVFIEDETSYKKRKRLFSDAIGDLYAMSRPIRELSCFDMISEKDLEEMCNLITDSIRLIRAIKNSDEEKYTKQ